MVAVALAASYFVLRRTRAPAAVAAAPSTPLPPPVAVAVPRTDQGAGGARPAALVEPTLPVAADDPPAAAAEGPLPTWVRVTIVAAALLAFFAVSLIATKRV